MRNLNQELNKKIKINSDTVGLLKYRFIKIYLKSFVNIDDTGN